MTRCFTNYLDTVLSQPQFTTFSRQRVLYIFHMCVIVFSPCYFVSHYITSNIYLYITQLKAFALCFVNPYYHIIP